jgi:hypothetical protein
MTRAGSAAETVVVGELVGEVRSQRVSALSPAPA